MTVNTFDSVAMGIVDYSIYDRDHKFIDSFTRDIFQEPEVYRRNLVKLDKYSEAKIDSVRCLNDIIRVTAVID